MSINEYKNRAFIEAFVSKLWHAGEIIPNPKNAACFVHRVTAPDVVRVLAGDGTLAHDLVKLFPTLASDWNVGYYAHIFERVVDATPPEVQPKDVSPVLAAILNAPHPPVRFIGLRVVLALLCSDVYYPQPQVVDALWHVGLSLLADLDSDPAVVQHALHALSLYARSPLVDPIRSAYLINLGPNPTEDDLACIASAWLILTPPNIPDEENLAHVVCGHQAICFYRELTDVCFRLDTPYARSVLLWCVDVLHTFCGSEQTELFAAARRDLVARAPVTCLPLLAL